MHPDKLLRETAELMNYRGLAQSLPVDFEQRLEHLKYEICILLMQKHILNSCYPSEKDNSLSKDIFQETIAITLSDTFLCSNFIKKLLESEEPWEFFYTHFLFNRKKARALIFKNYASIYNGEVPFEDLTDKDLHKHNVFHDPRNEENIPNEIQSGDLRKKVKSIIKNITKLSMSQLKKDAYREILKYRTGCNGDVLEYKEIAKKLNITENNARRRYFYAKNQLLTYCSKNLDNHIAREKDESIRDILNEFKVVLNQKIKKEVN